MGMSKIKVIGPGQVKILHQLNEDGTPYAEDVLITSDVSGRLAHLEHQDGKVGVFSYSFSAYNPEPEGLLFSE